MAGIAVFHDYFAIRGGGERLVLTLARALGGTLVFGYREAETYPPQMFPADTRDLALPRILRRSGIRPFALAAAFRRARPFAVDRQVRIFSGVAAPFAAPERSVSGRNIFYCHTPPRFLFDQRAFFLERLPVPARIALAPALDRFERAYRRAVDRMDVIVTNSENTRRRIERYLGRDSIVVHPPIDTGSFVCAGQGDYYLSTARLAPLKRVDCIVDAFLRMPERKLVVVSGGSEMEALKTQAGGASNIDFRGWVDESELRTLLGSAIASIYLPTDEDFGMSPVESMAAGKPVIGVAEGGLLETVIDGETGFLLKPGFGPEELAAAIRRMSPEKAVIMQAACEARAREFSEEKFIAAMRTIIAGSG